MGSSSRIASSTPFLDRSSGEEESFVTDDRTAVRPSQQVEQKLVRLMQATPLLLSQLQSRRQPNAR